MTQWSVFEPLEPRLLLDGQPASVVHSQLFADADLIRLHYEMPALEVTPWRAAETDDLQTRATLGDSPLGPAGGRDDAAKPIEQPTPSEWPRERQVAVRAVVDRSDLAAGFFYFL